MIDKEYKSRQMDIEAELWNVVYGTYAIVLGTTDSKEEAQRAADAMNFRFPAYNHRVVKVGEETERPTQRAQRAS